MAINDGNGFSLLMFKRLGKIACILFPGWCSVPTLLFEALIVISFLEQYVAYNVGLISSHYYQVLGDRNYDGFITTTVQSSVLVFLIALVLSTKNYISNILYICWRQILNQTLHSFYFSGINYYQLNVLEHNIDNPDQRMTQDVNQLCLSLSTVIVTIVIAPFQISYYTYATYNGTGWTGPLVIFIFFALFTVINKFIMSPMVNYYMEQEKCEGNFRFKHIHIRTNAESVAFHSSEMLECLKTNMSLYQLLLTQHTLFNKKIWLTLMQNIFDYGGAILSYLIIAIPVFNGAYDALDGSDLSSLISKNAFLCMTLMYSLSRLVNLAGSVVALSGVTHRVAQLIESLKHCENQNNHYLYMALPKTLSGNPDAYLSLDNERDSINEFEPKVLSTERVAIEVAYSLRNITVCPPNSQKELIKDLNLDIVKGTNILIMGASSSGKSSLLRVLKGIWPPKSGRIEHHIFPGPKTVLFLPQKPHFVNGCLYEQIIYPLKLDFSLIVPSDKELLEVAEDFKNIFLYDLLERCGGLLNDPMWNWDDILSPGEKQRLCFLRLFYHAPQYAFLDESTSALSFDVEDVLYERCLKLGITLISIGHRNSLLKYHDRLLKLIGDCFWSLSDIPKTDEGDTREGAYNENMKPPF